MQRFDFVAMTGYLIPLPSFEEFEGRDIIHAERHAGTRGGLAAIAMPKKPWGGTMHLYTKQYITTARTSGANGTYIVASLDFPPALSRLAVGSELSGLEAWLSMQATKAVKLIGAEVYDEGLSSAQKKAGGTKARASAHRSLQDGLARMSLPCDSEVPGGETASSSTCRWAHAGT